MKKVNLVASIPYHGNYLPGDFIGVDNGASFLFHQKIPMKAIIGDFDSIDSEILKELMLLDVDVIKLNKIKDETDLEAAIRYSIANEYEAINIYGALGQRVDHTLISLNLLKKHRNIVFYDDYSCIRVLKKGVHKINDEGYNYISLFAIENNTIISLDGFKYLLSDYVLDTDDTINISNEILVEASVENTKDIIIVFSK